MVESTVVSKPLHSSIISHLSTELSVLSAIIERSKFQHRTQPFLRRMREVLRLGSRVQDVLKAIGVDVNDTNAVELQVKVEVKKDLLVRFVQCLLKATVSIQQIIELEHFLPTQISVIAVYGRLFALGISISNYLSLDVEEVLSGQIVRVRRNEKRKRVSDGVDYGFPPVLDSTSEAMGVRSSAPRPEDLFDLGQKIERPSLETRVSESLPPSIAPSPSPLASHPESISSGSPPPSSPDILPSPIRIPTPEPKSAPSNESKPKLKKKRVLPIESQLSTTKKVKKKKKKDDMDDIFGF